MSKNNVIELTGREVGNDPLTELLRTGAKRLIYQAVEAELEALLVEHADRRSEDGKAGVIRNGHLPARKLQTGLGPVTVRISKVRAKTGEPVTFRSALVPPYVRKTKSLEAALPWLYLKGVSSGEMDEALKVLVGPEAEGLRTEQARLCALEVTGVNERGEKHFLAIDDGVRESTQSWREVLLKLKARGMNVPELAIGDGAMGSERVNLI